MLLFGLIAAVLLASLPAFAQTQPRDAVMHLATRMSSYNFDRNRIFTVTLTNGQVWRRVSGDTHTAPRSKAAGTYAVKITQ